MIDGCVRVPSKQVSRGSVRVNINELWGWSMPGEEETVGKKGETKIQNKEGLFKMPRASTDLSESFSSLPYSLAENQRSSGN